ncbi:hypothetical protein Ga0080574_TMP4664 [Salipiger abyssi]|uniref:Uncharacterized protein n=1 Tax=Salipiger abyssi TaxID=1250539 RepID=A0A1P8V038_9RHOB|nr:hypothetical protein Ga0080574_TMP4664 [Salipiger abyssi]
MRVTPALSSGNCREYSVNRARATRQVFDACVCFLPVYPEESDCFVNLAPEGGGAICRFMDMKVTRDMRATRVTKAMRGMKVMRAMRVTKGAAAPRH